MRLNLNLSAVPCDGGQRVHVTVFDFSAPDAGVPVINFHCDTPIPNPVRAEDIPFWTLMVMKEILWHALEAWNGGETEVKFDIQELPKRRLHQGGM
jgi:hypothetical protein